MRLNETNWGQLRPNKANWGQLRSTEASRGQLRSSCCKLLSLCGPFVRVTMVSQLKPKESIWGQLRPTEARLPEKKIIKKLDIFLVIFIHFGTFEWIYTFWGHSRLFEVNWSQKRPSSDNQDQPRPTEVNKGQMRSNEAIEVNWRQMRSNEAKRGQLTPNEAKRGQMRQIEVKWGQTRSNDVIEVNRGQMRSNEARKNMKLRCFLWFSYNFTLLSFCGLWIHAFKIVGLELEKWTSKLVAGGVVSIVFHILETWLRPNATSNMVWWEETKTLLKSRYHQIGFWVVQLKLKSLR